MYLCPSHNAPPAMPSSATPACLSTSHVSIEVISEELVVPCSSTPIEDMTEEDSRLPSQPQAPVKGAVADRERIALSGGENPCTTESRSTSEDAASTSREATPPSGVFHSAVPVSKRIRPLQLQLMGGEGGEEPIPSPVPVQGAADDQGMVTSGEVKVTLKEGIKFVKVVDIQRRPADFGLDSLIQREGQERGSGSEDEGVGASPSPPPMDSSAEHQESITSADFSCSHTKGFCASCSTSLHLETSVESSMNSTTVNTLHSRRKGQRHLYRSVKGLAPDSLFTKVEDKEKKKALARLYEAQTIQRRMGLLECQYKDLEEEDKKDLALQARSTGMDGHLLQQRLDPEHKRAFLSRQIDDLRQRMKDLEIEDQLYEIERELRELDQKADKTPADTDRYMKLLDEKLIIVDLRDGLVDKVDEEKRREEGKDFDQSQMTASMFGRSVELEQPQSSSTADVVTVEASNSRQKKKKRRWKWLRLQ